jgi:hypothetical protein
VLFPIGKLRPCSAWDNLLELNYKTSKIVTGKCALLLDGTKDLGFTAARFKDLYLSGGVYLGGTGAANLLDDYEGTDRSNTMALEKVVTEDKIEIVGEYKAVQVRTCTKVIEDGVELSSGYHRHVITAGQDYSGESAEVQAICAAVHTAEVIAAFEASQGDAP